jgi:hypothetical protein
VAAVVIGLEVTRVVHPPETFADRLAPEEHEAASPAPGAGKRDSFELVGEGLPREITALAEQAGVEIAEG